jgi:alkanesulfonate monooxygenase SsuD/methylene tetrahydromethanopterin reductase-like flavin-dependent oxidoreductase (luciferase family)
VSQQSHGPPEDLEIVEALVEQSVRAEGAGMASLCLTEHHFSGFNTYCDPFMLGAHIAGKLSRAYVAITVVQLALQHPVRVVEQSNILDLLTRGRCLIGLAAGSTSPIELAGFGTDVAQRGAMTEQRIDAMLRAWSRRESDDVTDVSTDFENGELRGRLTPASYRRPHPLLARATKTEATVVDCARRGWPVILAAPTDDSRRLVALYRETLEGAGHDDETVRECLAWLGFIALACVGETEREAKRRFDEYMEAAARGPDGAGGTALWAGEWTQRQFLRASVAEVGTPEQVAERVAAWQDDGAEHARISLIESPGRREETMEAFQLFVEGVVPLLDPQPLPDPPAVAASALS